MNRNVKFLPEAQDDMALLLEISGFLSLKQLEKYSRILYLFKKVAMENLWETSVIMIFPAF